MMDKNRYSCSHASHRCWTSRRVAQHDRVVAVMFPRKRAMAVKQTIGLDRSPVQAALLLQSNFHSHSETRAKDARFISYSGESRAPSHPAQCPVHARQLSRVSPEVLSASEPKSPRPPVFGASFAHCMLSTTSCCQDSAAVWTRSGWP